jgi:renal tumor antigen
VWAVGCIFYEVLSRFPLFAGNNDLDQVHKILELCGTEELYYFSSLDPGVHSDLYSEVMKTVEEK